MSPPFIGKTLTPTGESSLKLVYFGTAEFAVPALRAVGESVSLVVSQPDRPTGRGLKLQSSPVKETAIELGIPVETPERARAEDFIERLRAENADVFLVAAYGQILSTQVLEIPLRGAINLHGSILPAWRGAAPIQRAIEAGDSETGITLMQMDRGMDTGDIIAFERCPIEPDETAAELTPRLATLAAQMARTWMPRICAGDYTRIPQDHNQATYASKVQKSDALLTSELDANSAYRKVRAFTPSPGAWIRTPTATVKIHAARFAQVAVKPGHVEREGDTVLLGFGQASLRVTELQLEGKRRVSAREFWNGAPIEPGARWFD